MTEKLLSEREGVREEVLGWVGEVEEGQVEKERTQEKEKVGKGKGKAKDAETELTLEKGKREDLTLARNLALCVHSFPHSDELSQLTLSSTFLHRLRAESAFTSSFPSSRSLNFAFSFSPSNTPSSTARQKSYYLDFRRPEGNVRH